MCITLEAKKGSSVILDCTNEHSTTSGTPLSPLRQASANKAPAYLRHRGKVGSGLHYNAIFS